MRHFNDLNLENQSNPNLEWVSEEAYLEELEQRKEEEYYSELEKGDKEARKEALEAYQEWLEKNEGDFLPKHFPELKEEEEDDDLPF